MKTLLKKIFGFKDNQISKNELLIQIGHLKVGKGSDINTFSLDIRQSQQGKTYLEIGENCVINGDYVIETTSGKIKIGNNTFIGGGIFIAAEDIQIGNDVMFSWGCTVIDNDAHSLKSAERMNDVKDWKKGIDTGEIGKYKNWDAVQKGKTTICDKVWVGFNTIILKGITIGEGAVIGAGSVVTKNVPPYTIVAGNPAKEIRKTE